MGRPETWPRNLFFSALSPDESTVYVGVGSELIAFDTNTGAERWNLNTGNFIGSSPAVTSDGNIYFGSNDGSVYGRS